MAATRHRLPTCNLANIHVWFLMVEAEFKLRAVTCPKAQYLELLTAFTPELAELMHDVMLDPEIDEYDDLKKFILERAEDGPHVALQRFTSTNDLQGLKPSAYLRQLRRLLLDADQKWTEEYMKIFMLARMPPHIHTALQTSQRPLLELMKIADERVDDPLLAIATTTATVQFEEDTLSNNDRSTSDSPSVQELISKLDAIEARLNTRDPDRRPPSPHPRHRQRTPPARRQVDARPYGRRPREARHDDSELCWYHATYGRQAHNCRQPCTWSGNGPDRS